MVDLRGVGSAAPDQAATQRREPAIARFLKDWERTVAIAVGIVTLSAALLTYVAVRQDDAAAEARGQATLETLQVQRQRSVASIRVEAEASAASRYRRSLAEAEAMEAQATAAAAAGQQARAAQLRAEALVLRSVADAYRETTFDVTRLSGTTASASYDTERRLETIKGYEAFEALQPDQPAATAEVADARHAQSIRTMVSVVLLLLLVLLLTVGRVLRPRWRTAVLATTAIVFVIATAGAGLNAVVGG